jgi:hypothetical protein
MRFSTHKTKNCEHIQSSVSLHNAICVLSFDFSKLFVTCQASKERPGPSLDNAPKQSFVLRVFSSPQVHQYFAQTIRMLVFTFFQISNDSHIFTKIRWKLGKRTVSFCKYTEIQLTASNRLYISVRRVSLGREPS